MKCHTVNDVMSYLFDGDASAAYIMADLGWDEREDKVELMLQLKEEGYSRFFSDKVIRIEEVMQKAQTGDYPSQLYLLIDRVKLPKMSEHLPLDMDQTSWEDLQTRLHSSVETAFDKGEGTIVIRKELNDGSAALDKFINRFEAVILGL